MDDTTPKTCFAAHAEHGVCCKRTSCRSWIDSKKHLNCVLLAAREGPMTLQHVGDVFGLTRMRICQVEKEACRKIVLPIVYR